MLSNLSKLSDNVLVSLSPENITGEKGRGAMTPIEKGSTGPYARDLGIGWKVNPCIYVDPGKTLTIADVKDRGEITQIWMTPTGSWRGQILRFYWDGEETPAVECPLGDFFACGLEEYAPVNSIPVCVNPGRSFNCFWKMPFRKGFRITLENRNAEQVTVFYQVNYIRKPVGDDAAYFHAQFRRENPTGYMKDFTMLDNVQGKGQYVGTYMTHGVNNNGWWGEGEVKAYIDGDMDFPTVCYTGTEDYFLGSYNFENRKTHQYEEYTTAYAGLPQVLRPDGLYRSQTRFGMYRWHLTDPIYFTQNIRLTCQMLGWRSGPRYLPMQDDVSCVAFFYLDKPSCNIPKLGSYDDLELV